MEEYIPKSKVLELWRYWKYIEAYDQCKAMKGIEIVKCKECTHSEASLNDGCVYCTQLMWTMNPDDYCSYGERRK